MNELLLPYCKNEDMRKALQLGTILTTNIAFHNIIDFCIDIYVMMSSDWSETWSSAHANSHQWRI